MNKNIQLLPLTFEAVARAIIASSNVAGVGLRNIFQTALLLLRESPTFDYFALLSTEEQGTVIVRVLDVLLKLNMVKLEDVDSDTAEHYQTVLRQVGEFDDERLTRAYSAYPESTQPLIPSERGIKMRFFDSHFLEEPPKRRTAYAVQKVFFATDRHRINVSEFTGRRGDAGFSYGSCDVSIPDIHRIGDMERPPWLLGLIWDGSPLYHIKLLETVLATRATF
jgi:hypothetical protein